MVTTIPLGTSQPTILLGIQVINFLPPYNAASHFLGNEGADPCVPLQRTLFILVQLLLLLYWGLDKVDSGLANQFISGL